jgi:hypothetical protein
MTLEPCNLEVVGVAGSLSIFGRGTAVFALSFHDTEILIRVHNCLYSFGEFNLLSVSQMQTIKGNTLNLSLDSPSVRLRAGSHPSNVPSWERQPYVDIPLGLDDGLYCMMLEPISSDDSRLRTLQMFDLTPPPVNTSLTLNVVIVLSVYLRGFHEQQPRWAFQNHSGGYIHSTDQSIFILVLPLLVISFWHQLVYRLPESNMILPIHRICQICPYAFWGEVRIGFFTP